MARNDARSSSLRRRPSRTVPAAVASALLTALGVTVVWASVERLATGHFPTWVGSAHAWAAGQTWGSAGVLVIGVLVALVGLLLLVSAIVPGKPTAYELEPGEQVGMPQDGAEFVMTRRSVAKLATARAHLVEGVDSVHAVVTGRSVSLTVGTASNQRTDVESAVSTAVTDTLTSAGLTPVPTVSARARTGRP